MGTATNTPYELNEYARTAIRVKAGQLKRRRELAGESQEDIEQQLTLYLLAQAHRYDAKRAQPNTFAIRVINSAVASLLRAKRAAKRRPRRRVRSLDAPVRSDTHAPLITYMTVVDAARRTGAAPQDSLETAERAELLRQAVAALPERLREVWQRLLEASPTQVALDLGWTRRDLRNALTWLRVHFAAFGLGES